MIPFSAMFCSSRCADNGGGMFMCATEEFAIVPRMLLQALDFCDGNLSNLSSALVGSNPELQDKTVFDVGMNEADETKQILSQYLALNSLKRGVLTKEIVEVIEGHPILQRWASHNDKEIVKEVMRHITAITVNNGLSFEWRKVVKEGKQMRPNLKDFKACEDETESERSDSFLELFFNIYLGIGVSSRRDKFVTKTRHLESKLHPKMDSRESMTVGNGIFPIASLFNHSCCHNADRLAVDNKLVIYVRRPIKAGEQVFINYG